MTSPCVFLVGSLLLLLERTCAQETPRTGSKDICLQPPLKGPCRAIHYRWHYDRYSQTCKEFTYGGCQGNDNNFLNVTECSETCKGIKTAPSFCYSPKDEGSCSASVPRFYYNTKTKTCEKFSYTGCGGNNNNFTTEKSCLKICRRKTRKQIL
ncbi:tissue factor pathway inhibitor 2 isoform X2 [Python bivittatus]|uniref:Tissue factor pathway inhibitor 2 isoform X2 n=1 Tax=Python bivittatus TaxID=176946 RepID=A0A9F5IMP5_PYTBI|nr:tissue factor pathway inhibitor 2 isoform X2 [Python bivittatus]